MSFVAKAVKKVVKGVGKFVKKVVKSKWFKIAAVVALTVFTAGVGAAGGWAAFSAQAFGSGVSGFFSAVGSTMSAGWSAITGAVSLGGTGASATLGAAPLTESTAAALAAEGGVIGSSGIGVAGIGISGSTALETSLAAAGGVGGGSMASALGTAGLASTAGKAAAPSLLSRIGGLFMDPGLKGTMLRNGVIAGYQAYAANRQWDKERYYKDNATVAGGAAFGGSDEWSPALQPLQRHGEDTTEAQNLASQDNQLLKSQPLESAPQQQAPQVANNAQQAPQAQQSLLQAPQAQVAQAQPQQQTQGQQQDGLFNKFTLENFGVA